MKGTYLRGGARPALSAAGSRALCLSFPLLPMLSAGDAGRGFGMKLASVPLFVKEAVKMGGVVPRRLRIQFKEVPTGQRWTSLSINKNCN